MFRFRFRMRYGECDAQSVVFNARYATLAGTGHKLSGANFPQRNEEDPWRRPATPAPPEMCDSSLRRI